jgi:flagellar basal-body rod modification protein FlgD
MAECGGLNKFNDGYMEESRMDIGSMMSAATIQKGSSQVASGLVTQKGHGLTTSANATLPKTSLAARSSAAAGSAASSSSSSTSDSNDITSNDFLTLLVTEMQNQDPTQPTDPNAYIQQLVGVNSLQQLISINQELGTATGSTSSGTSGSVTGVSGAAPGSSAAQSSSSPFGVSTLAPTDTLPGS